jgi:exopolyphosphatase/guanosine-5'-triphosphate,3'-diphosphate pyrophosphatase
MTPARRDSHVFGAVDLGSNTIKLKLWSIAADGEVTPLQRRRFPVRLGRGTFANGRLADDLIEGAVATMREIHALANEAGASEIRAVATSAVRAASNAEELLARIAAETGVAVEVASAEREGELTARGALTGLDLAVGETVAVIDIGGGSAEVIEAVTGDSRRGTRVHPIGLPLGAVRLTEAHLPSDPPTSREVGRLREAIREILGQADLTPHHGLTVGCGGTLVTVERMATRVCGPSECGAAGDLPLLPVEALKHTLGELLPLTVDRRVERFGLERQRAEVIVAGAVALESILTTLEVEEIAVTVRGLREGLLAEHLEAGGN